MLFAALNNKIIQFLAVAILKYEWFKQFFQ